MFLGNSDRASPSGMTMISSPQCNSVTIGKARMSLATVISSRNTMPDPLVSGPVYATLSVRVSVPDVWVAIRKGMPSEFRKNFLPATDGVSVADRVIVVPTMELTPTSILAVLLNSGRFLAHRQGFRAIISQYALLMYNLASIRWSVLDRSTEVGRMSPALRISAVRMSSPKSYWAI